VTIFRIGLLALILSCAASAQYQYYHDEYTPDNNYWWDASWHVNGTVNGGQTGSGLVGSSYGTGALISTIPVPDGSSDYEVSTTWYITPDTGADFVMILRASSDAMPGQGTYYSVEFQNPGFGSAGCAGTLVVNKRVNNVLTTLASAPASCAVRARMGIHHHPRRPRRQQHHPRLRAKEWSRRRPRPPGG
jgi:hypothetical protein